MTKFLFLFICATLVAADRLFGFDLGAADGIQTASVGLLGVGSLFRSPDPGAPDGGGAKGTIGEQLTAAKSEVATLTGRVTALEADLATANGASETAATELATTKATLAEKETELATAQADLATAKAATTAAEAEVEKLKGEAKTADERAQEIVASLGFPSGKLPAADDNSAENIADLRAKVGTTKDPAEKAALVARIRKLRDAQVD